ncbi:putative Acid phosphatase SurE, survival protein [Nostocoides japonicum T1-X7]|uniref:5'-nucleotidase n=1 Tax=Nostocoides japonicum T1-X7 TaxID=1194083 RepID=A0A077LSX5_9MICO|nr:5'/3'-nucleotidase SurE [Tetrasphaera japonica]CCH76348.1 putative Acid phosphatase SurE, survival protein [Tetrasphaera japonica T1-X7]
MARHRFTLAATALGVGLTAVAVAAGTAGQATASEPSLAPAAAASASSAAAVESAAVSAASASSRSGSVKGLRILIVNDDSIQGQSASGSDGKGLYALRHALCAAGADVIAVGPWTVQSGMGGRITLTGPMTVQQVQPPAGYGTDCAGAPTGGRVFGVCAAAAPCVTATASTPASPSGSPSDAAIIALTKFIPDNYWPDGPDLVVSGINFGQNDAVTVYHSGTDSALVTAHRLGSPGIAFSEELTTTCLAGQGSCPEYTKAAAFATRLIGAVRKAHLITPKLALNVNYPHLEPGQRARRPELNVLGQCTAINFGPSGSVPAEGGTYSMGLVPSCKETTRNADTTALAHKHISIVPFDGDWTGKAPAGLRGLIRNLG